MVREATMPKRAWAVNSASRFPCRGPAARLVGRLSPKFVHRHQIGVCDHLIEPAPVGDLLQIRLGPAKPVLPLLGCAAVMSSTELSGDRQVPVDDLSHNVVDLCLRLTFV